MCRTQQKSQSVKSVTYLQNTNSPSSLASSFTGAFCQRSPQKVLLNGSHESICSIYYLNAQVFFPAVYTFLLQQSGLIKSISVSSQTLKIRQGRDCWSCSALSTLNTPEKERRSHNFYNTYANAYARFFYSSSNPQICCLARWPVKIHLLAIDYDRTSKVRLKRQGCIRSISMAKLNMPPPSLRMWAGRWACTAITYS